MSQPKHRGVPAIGPRLQARTAASSAAEHNLQRLRLGGSAECVIGVHDLVQLELMGSEPLGRQLAGGNELEQHRRGVGANQSGRNRDVVDPEIIQRQLDGFAVYAGVGNRAARPDDLRARCERGGKSGTSSHALFPGTW